MKEIQLPLRTAYLNALDSVQVNGKTIPVYDELAPEDAPDHYIILTNQTDRETPVKGAFKNDAFLTVDINTSFKKGYGGKELSERIAGAVLEIVRGATGALVIGDGLQIVSVKKDGSESLTEHLPTRSIYRKILIFKHKVVQI